MLSLQFHLTAINGPAIRGIKEQNGEERFSVYDFINKVCEKTDGYGNTTYFRLTLDDSEHKDEILKNVKMIKFPGKGQRETPTMTLVGLERLLMILGGRIAKEFRILVENTFRRVMAGDRSLIKVIEENASSDSPVQQAYRKSLEGEPASTTLEDLCLKRKREELELRDMEISINQRAADTYGRISGMKNIDERAKIIFQDALLNTIMPAKLGDENTPISLSQYLEKKKVVLGDDELLNFGKIASKLYRDINGKPPSKHRQLVRGRATDVNSYFKKDEELLEQAWKMYCKEGEKKSKHEGNGEAAMKKWLGK